MSEETTWHLCTDAYAQHSLLTKRESFTMRVQGLFYQSYDELVVSLSKLEFSKVCCGSSILQLLLIFFFIAQKVKKEQQILQLLAGSVKSWVPWLNLKKKSQERKLSVPSTWTSAVGKGWIDWSLLFKETIICLSEISLHAVIAINSIPHCKYCFSNIYFSFVYFVSIEDLVHN